MVVFLLQEPGVLHKWLFFYYKCGGVRVWYFIVFGILLHKRVFFITRAGGITYVVIFLLQKWGVLHKYCTSSCFDITKAGGIT